MRRETAAQISSLMVEYGARLNDSVRLVREASSSDEEFQTYRRAIGKIMGFMLTEVMNPLYEEHPDLKPTELQ